MSISFNHPSNTMTSTGSLNLIVNGGSTTSPAPIRFNSTSIVMPVRALPTGEAGAMVFDNGTKTMKYHNGTSWVDILAQDVILAPIYTQLTTINQQLAGKVDTVTYISGSVPQASISGTQLNITFPLSSGGGGTGNNGLYTSSKQGSIQMYSLTSGMGADSIREQMSGVSGGQSGRNGTSGSPYITNDGWCFADGLWWTWVGANGTVTQQVPNLNQQAYLKPISVNGFTQTSSVIQSSTSIGSTTIQFPQHFHGIGQVGSTGGSSADDGYFIFGRTWSDGNAYQAVGVFGEKNNRQVITASGGNAATALSTTNAIYINGSDTNTHTHSIDNLDVPHQNVAVLYNIATPSYALNESTANTKYVLKGGDVMTGSLTIAASATIKGDATNLPLLFSNSSNGERAMIYHSNSTNTLRLRSAGGAEVSISNTGLLTTPSLVVSNASATVSGQNVVRSVNGQTANAAGAVTLSSTSASLTDNGWWKDSNTGMITQWGFVASTGNDLVVTFPIQFPNKCFSVTLGQGYNSHNDQDKTARLMSAPTTSQCVIYVGSSEFGVYWQAIGH